MKKLFFVLFCVFFAVGCESEGSKVRYDAEVNKAKNNFTALIADINAYYTIKETLSDNLQDMTTIEVGKNGEFFVDNSACLQINIKDNNLLITNTSKGKNKICTGFMQNDSVKKILGGVDLSKDNSTTIKLGEPFKW